MKSLPRAWWAVVVLIGVFALGVLFDRYLMPFLSRDVWVWAIHGVEGRGCEGSTAATSFRLGTPVDRTNGVYKITCDGIGFASETAGLVCECR
jgi:hypothetical protein